MLSCGLLPGEISVDLFAGGGGTSTGHEMALGRSPDVAVNHDREAIAMHQRNHPFTKHYCEEIQDVSPRRVAQGRPVGLLWASPDCKDFSKAKGGQPVDKQIRGLAWQVVRWARDVQPRIIILENVEEFQDWGPLDEHGKRIKARKGETFKRWVQALRFLGYHVEWHELRACDYGAPTTRKRLFVIARRDGEAIIWPRPTHGPGRAHPWRTAAECIDWSIPCPSIFGRKKPLAENTMRRIARGLQRYVIDHPDPFIVSNMTGNVPRPVSEPTSTILGRNHHHPVQPFLAHVTHQGDRRVHPVTEPAPTVTGAARGELAVVEPVLAPYVARIGQTGGNGTYTSDARQPLTTVVSKAEHLVVAPTLIQAGYGEREGQAPRCLDLHKPLGTVVAGGGKFAVTGAHLAKHNGGNEATGQQLDAPMDTITAVDTKSLVTSNLVHLRGGLADHPNTARDVRDPVPCLTAGGNHVAEVRAFLIQYNGQDCDPRLDSPLHTVTTKDRFGLVMWAGQLWEITDIGMRMLSPRELYRAQGFDDAYVIDIEVDGKRLTQTAQVRMAGNCVPPHFAAALIRANTGGATAADSEWHAPVHVQLSLFDLPGMEVASC